ncbi:ribulokinase [Christensenella tenuis]|uniref:Ribulokinase n=1 Tax=Christensenella tenuis TaxID=2763033 RepID=A0ABR7EFB3_9FIRM|nr:ribulokinase [Christensenella tenuis]MBC5648450.1 ribulokinase [Christensenella tenuis]
MEQKRYALGVDFGTLSARCVLVEMHTGEIAASSSCEYPHGVMDTALPCGRPLPADWALQHPQDYIDTLAAAVPEVLRSAGASGTQICGVGIDFTSCTVLPVTAEGTPLCFLPEYASEPHAYVKLWKHHAAQKEATRLNQIAQERGEKFLENYGRKISSEWVVPKAWQILNEAPKLYEKMAYFVEAGDWIVAQLTGRLWRNACAAGYKAIWSKTDGFPSRSFFAALDPRMEDFAETKLNTPILPLGGRAGGITARMAKLTGLAQGTPVAAANLDAHVSCLGAGLTRPGQMLAIMGTSTCHLVNSSRPRPIPGVCGIVPDGLIPGLIGYEAGQSCVGDHFSWFVKNCVPAAYERRAQEEGTGIYEYLTRLAEKKVPGESGLIALDWWNGNRSVLVDGDLSGLLLGCTLGTKPEDIFRALMEATAYGTRMILESFAAAGIPVDEFYAAGGIAQKNPFMMQLYANITGREIRVVESAQLPAFSAALYGALAAGRDGGGCAGIGDAAQLACRRYAIYTPDPGAAAAYDVLYQEYVTLHNYFGRGANDVMKRLKAMRRKGACYHEYE